MSIKPDFQYVFIDDTNIISFVSFVIAIEI